MSYIFLLDYSLKYYVVTFFVSCLLPLLLMSILSDINNATYVFFFFMFICMEYIFHPLTFILCISFVLKWVSCRQHICSCVFLSIHLPYIFKLKHLIYAFKFIIDRYLFITIFSLYTCVSLSLHFFSKPSS